MLRSNMPQYATTSLAWDRAIEPICNRKSLKSTEIEDFNAIYRDDRCRSLAKLTFDVVLLTYDDKSCG